MFEGTTVGLHARRDGICNRGALLLGLKSISLDKRRRGDVVNGGGREERRKKRELDLETWGDTQ